MRDGWTETTLGDIAHWSSGKNLSSDKRHETGLIPILGANGIIGRTNEVLLDEELITVGRVGACGETHRSSGPVWISDNALIVIPTEQVTIDLLFYVLSTFNYQSIISGTTQPLITQSKMKSQVVNLPPLVEQKRIVDVMSYVDAYIDALQQQADTARAARNAVLHELLSAGGDDWTDTTLGDIAKFVRGPFGGSLKKEIFVQSGFAVYEQQHAIYGDFVNFRYFVNKEKFDEMKRFSVSTGDLLMSCSGTVGKVSLVPSGAPVGIINQALLKISTSSQVSSAFLLYWTQSEIFHLLIQENSGGAVQQNVASVKLLKDIRITLPPIDEQKRIVEIVSAMDDVIQSTEQAVLDAKNLRSGLLSDLLSGEHEIPASYDSLLGAA